MEKQATIGPLPLLHDRMYSSTCCLDSSSMTEGRSDAIWSMRSYSCPVGIGAW